MRLFEEKYERIPVSCLLAGPSTQLRVLGVESSLYWTSPYTTFVLIHHVNNVDSLHPRACSYKILYQSSNIVVVVIIDRGRQYYSVCISKHINIIQYCNRKQIKLLKEKTSQHLTKKDFWMISTYGFVYCMYYGIRYIIRSGKNRAVGKGTEMLG